MKTTPNTAAEIAETVAASTDEQLDAILDWSIEQPGAVALIEIINAERTRRTDIRVEREMVEWLTAEGDIDGLAAMRREQEASRLARVAYERAVGR